MENSWGMASWQVRRRNWQKRSLSWNRSFRMIRVWERCWDMASCDNSLRKETRGPHWWRYSLAWIEILTFRGCLYQGLPISDSSTVESRESGPMKEAVVLWIIAQMIGLWVGQTSIAKLLHWWAFVFLWFYCGVIKYATLFYRCPQLRDCECLKSHVFLSFKEWTRKERI